MGCRVFEDVGDGWKPGLAKVVQRQAYFDLVAQGVSSRQACQLVGIGRRTGYEWRYPQARAVQNAKRAVRKQRQRASTRYCLLLHLGAGRAPEQVRDALLATVTTLPEQLRRSLTWDQGNEMALHHQFSTATGMPVYFCDPHSPWQRGSNENTNGLLRQYFPKGTDLTRHSPEHLAAVAAELNSRPRMTLDWDTPAERLAKLLTTNGVATTP